VAQRINGSDLRLSRPAGDEDVFIIASQDCDICCDSYDEEPMFEVVLARRVASDKEDGNLFYGKNPRRLQLLIQQGESHDLYSLNINERLPVPRSFLAEAQDQPSGSLSARDLEVFRRWLGRRYYRSALPTEFNERCRPAQELASKQLKKHGRLITAVYLQLDPRYEELDSLQSYRVYVHLTVAPETLEAPGLLQQALKAQAVFETAFAKCTGVELLGVQLISESEFSLRDIQQSARWDNSDHISYKASPPEALAPEA
jgi:hypothetical protein